MNRKGLIGLLLLTGASSIALGVSFTAAWFVSDLSQADDFRGSSVAAYFAGGDGSEENPYLLTDPVHFYNLSWLQDTGAFQNEFRHFSVPLDNGSPRVIDFVGAFDGDSSHSGAIPPIGTSEFPFDGVFDGNYCVLKNIWVSTRPSDWKEHPDNTFAAESSLAVGLFGQLAKKEATEQISSVSRFYLENIEVSSHVDGSSIGLIAGVNDGSTLERIAVKNGKISMASGQSYSTEHSLIGKMTENSYWIDMPSSLGTGGVLKVDPNDSSDWPPSGFSSIGNGSYAPIPNSIPGSAFLVGSMSNPPNNESIKTLNGMYLHEKVLSVSSNQSVTSSSKTALTETDEASKLLLERYNALAGSSAKSIYFGGQNNAVYPTQTATTTVEYQDDQGASHSLLVPKNCLWFRPKAPGNCLVSFAVGNQSNSRYASIYRYLGNADGSLPAQFTWTELELCLPKGTYGNGQCVAYQINISEEEVAAGYEFVIGRSSKNAANTAGFFYLYLAGTDKNSGTSDGKGGIALIDYAHYGADGVTLFPKFADIASPEGYKPLNTCLVFDGTTSSDAYVLCNTKDGSDASTTVYYSSSGIAVSEQITASPASSFTSDSSLFPPRLVN